MIRRVLTSAVVVLVLVFAPRAGAAQAKVIQAADGDVIHVPQGASVVVARETRGHVRVTSHQNGQLIVVLVDEGPQPDGIVDFSHRFELEQGYPPQYVYDGPGAFEELETVGPQRFTRSYALVLPQGRILLMQNSPAGRNATAPQYAAAVAFRSSAGNRTRAAFDDAEKAALAGSGYPRAESTLIRGGVVSGGVVGGVVGGSVSGGVQSSVMPNAPVRVGGSIRQPVKIRDAAPVVPEVAARAGIRGVVILEATIDTQGRVSEARVLRSIPLLDQAAIDAVRQWVYEPTLLQGVPVPVIMTVTVSFNPQ